MNGRNNADCKCLSSNVKKVNWARLSVDTKGDTGLKFGPKSISQTDELLYKRKLLSIYSTIYAQEDQDVNRTIAYLDTIITNG